MTAVGSTPTTKPVAFAPYFTSTSAADAASANATRIGAHGAPVASQTAPIATYDATAPIANSPT